MTNTNSRIEPGTRVLTVEPDQISNDWTKEALASRQWGVEGHIVRHHDAHGLTYEVLHPDSSVGHYEPRELEVLSTSAFVEESWIVHGSVYRGEETTLWVGERRCYEKGEPVQVGFDWKYAIDRELSHGDVIGWFHTHPGFSAHYSDRDQRTMSAWTIALGKPLLCFILGNEGLRCFLFEDEEEIIEIDAHQTDVGLLLGGTSLVWPQESDTMKKSTEETKPSKPSETSASSSVEPEPSAQT